MINSKLPENLEQMIGAAVSHYWVTRLSQQQKQQKSGKVDYGLRRAVTGGAQMDGFIELLWEIDGRPAGRYSGSLNHLP